MTAIAIVGMDCRFPDSPSPSALWENVLAQRRAFRRIPDERLNQRDYVGEAEVDATYIRHAAVLEGWAFDRGEYRVSGDCFRATDPTHWLALEVAAGALADAGFARGEGLPRDRTGVILGNSLTGDVSRANSLRLRWPYMRRVAEAALAEGGLDAEARSLLLVRMEEEYKRPFPPTGSESLAGGLSNTIAGRICNHFDLHGGGYTVDGACAASLLSVATACNSLQAGDLDLAVAGGVDLSLDPFELAGFARLGALAREPMRVFDLEPTGFWPGEGCGMVVLMREEDALALGRRPYAVIRGWGVSSDGSGGLTRPRLEGQRLALARAYQRAGFGPAAVSLFEAHGTGTEIGDMIELRTLAEARREDDEKAAPAAIGSVKANIGHTKAAAGIAGLIKAVMAVHSRLIPPTTGCRRRHPLLAEPDAMLEVRAEGMPWPEEKPGRAGVSAMGFGGINTHLVLEEGGLGKPRTARRLTDHEARLLASSQDCDRRSGVPCAGAVLERIGGFRFRPGAALGRRLAGCYRRRLARPPSRRPQPDRGLAPQWGDVAA